MTKLHIIITVTGNVQGVGFRAYVKTEADRLGIMGFVKNCSDSSVCIEAEGEQDTLNQLIAWCHHGPELANVEKVEVQEGECIGVTGFDIRRAIP